VEVNGAPVSAKYDAASGKLEIGISAAGEVRVEWEKRAIPVPHSTHRS
jgi:hypothetical protein